MKWPQFDPKLVENTTVKPRFNECTRDWQNMFAITRFFLPWLLLFLWRRIWFFQYRGPRYIRVRYFFYCNRVANNNLKELETLVNRELGNVNEWLKANKLSLNIKKSNFVIFRPRQKNMPFIPRIRILDSVTNTYANLEMKDYVKYLGLMIDSNLSWKYHIKSICHKISKLVGIVAKIRHYVPRRVYSQFTTH